MKRSIWIALAVVVLGFALAESYFLLTQKAGSQAQVFRIGITPYQDSALPIVADRKGWYDAAGLHVRLVPLTWDQVIPALSSGAIDVAIYNMNSFSAPYWNAAKRSPKPIFYAPLYVFKGQAIMVNRSADLITVGTNGAADIKRIVAQLKGKRIAVTKGTELEQIVLAALSKAGLSPTDVTLIHASPEDSLSAFLANNVDAFAGGLTERVEARRHGAVELLTEADVMRPVIDGLVTTDSFATDHPVVLEKFLDTWFQTIRYIATDVSKNSVEIRDYLKSAASTRYSPEEYAIAWTFDIFPTDREEASDMFSKPNSIYYWKASWDDISRFLIQQKQISAPVPYDAYWGDRALGPLPAKDGALK